MFAGEFDTGQALEAVARAKRRPGVSGSVRTRKLPFWGMPIGRSWPLLPVQSQEESLINRSELRLN